MTWGEFVTWLRGWDYGQYNVIATMLRQIAYQQITLNPYIDKVDKPYRLQDYIRFPFEETDSKKEVEYIDPKKLAEIWKI
jgi:hypothetical protein